MITPTDALTRVCRRVWALTDGRRRSWIGGDLCRTSLKLRLLFPDLVYLARTFRPSGIGTAILSMAEVAVLAAVVVNRNGGSGSQFPYSKALAFGRIAGVPGLGAF